jgi:hypothetical protein
MSKPLNDAEIARAIRRLLESQHPGRRWVGAKYLYAQFFANPGRFGAPSVYAMPIYPRFERVCRAMFETKIIDGEVEIYVGA